MQTIKWLVAIGLLMAVTGFLARPAPPTGEAIYKANCAVCHGGSVAEAPRLEALQKLSSAAIIAALETGVMRAQGAALSPAERQLVADYLSKTDSPNARLALGPCDSLVSSSPEKGRVTSWGLDLNNRRFQSAPDLGISASNVGTLRLNWAFAFPNATRARVQPTVAGNTLFTASQHGTVYALDVATGCVRWTFQADAEIRSAIVVGTDKRGLANRLYFSDFKANVYALDLQTRQLRWRKRVDEHAQATITGSLVVYGDRLFVPLSSTEVVAAYSAKYPCCTFRGAVVALAADDGALVWKTYMTDEPTPRQLNSAGTQTYGPSGAPVWSSPTIDPKRGVLYVGTGENYSRPASPTSDAIVALSLTNGAIRWVHQTISQDAWNAACTQPGLANCPDQHGPDYDFGAPPLLVSRPGKPDLVLAGQKSGMVYALDPDAGGAVIWQQRVGRGGIMGGVHWGMTSDGQTLYVPINDREAWPADSAKPAFPGLHALDVANGRIKWSAIEKNRCPPGTKWGCGPGLSAAITLIPGVVFGGALDGMLHAYSTTDGRVLWAYDTNQSFTAVNGLAAGGGAIDSAGPVVVGNQLFINSGYAKFNEKAGNVLLAFTVK
ncbi:outer membrane protein assembly factor BamB family protein [Fibrella aquatilis]|uniref:PQQ-binding-like beta-propeller repeat protein n=1 Tax=Fibrella aquatilis TaxID=2817059 RepID=A0A939G301_9BACT|nr:PQQ-binding-like beta-propeller repeat protein [Fibrella aquatilis]MBO0930140.1 PQQ-binding-like beta-propeller repeat protein [Fibrella aquatilis]